MNAPPPLPAGMRPKDPRAQEQSATMGVPMETIISIAVGALVYLIYGIGAYRLSYNTSGSVFLGILAFLFAPLYYPYYGLFVSQPQPLIMGGRRRKH